jgi:hypothetical protein
LEMNVVFLGVSTAQAVPLLLISLALLAIAGLAAMRGIAGASRAAATRRAVLQRAAVPMPIRREPEALSAMLTASLPARAPPTFPSGRSIGVPLRDDLRS